MQTLLPALTYTVHVRECKTKNDHTTSLNLVLYSRNGHDFYGALINYCYFVILVVI